MAAKYLHLPSFPSTLTPLKPKPLPKLPPIQATTDEDTTSSNNPPTSTDEDTDFDQRLSQIRLKYRSGTGKKAEKRKSRKTGGATTSTSSGKKGSALLPPVPLKQAMSANGVAVEVGFTEYSERLNGYLAGLGLAAVLLVELASGKSFISYHAPAVIFIQAYSVLAATALFIKFEKEKISVWPEKSPNASGDASRGE